jgi:hypothetical protein
MVLPAALLSAVVALPARAADEARPWGAAGLVPEDAAFFSSTLRAREQIEAILRSNAWARLTDLPLVQAGWRRMREELNKPKGDLAPLFQFYRQPENRQLVELLLDMGSEEVFCYGGHSWVDFTDVLTGLSGGMQLNRLLARLQSPDRAAQQKIQIQALLDTLSEHADKLQVPSLLIGFKVSQPQRAHDQLRRLEQLVKGPLEQNPHLKGRFHRTQVAGSRFLTLELDGRMVPWQEIPLKEFEDKPGQYDGLIKKLQGIKLTVALGVHKGYVILAVGKSTDAVARLGQGQALAGRPEFRPLLPFANRRLSSIDYASKAIRGQFQMTRGDLDQMADGLKELLKPLDIPAARRDKIIKDLNGLGKDLKKYVPEVGASLSFTFLTDRGQETYAYDWTKYADVDASKPLTLLDHVGGSPLLALVGRSKYDPAAYQLVVKWAKVIYADVEPIVLEKLEPEQKDRYEEIAKVVFPLLKRLDEVTGKMLLPALRDGQSGFVVDAKIKSKQWVTELQETDKPLPMIEPALVFGVSDAPLLRRAFEEYRSIANDGLAKLREFAPILPEFEIPVPEAQSVKGGMLYHYPPLPYVDEQILPNAGLSEKVAILSLSPAQSRRMLVATPLTVTGGPLANRQRPLTSAAYVDWPEIVNTIEPWVDFGIRTAGPFAEQFFGEQAGQITKAAGGVDGLLKQVHTLFQVAKVLHGYTSATYLENGALVTHSETVVRDVK